MLKKSGVWIFALILLFTFVPQRTHAGFFDPKLKWYTIKTPHFNIHFHDGEEEVAHRMAMIAEKVYAELTPRFRWKPFGRVEVLLTDTTDISNAITTTLPYNYIILFLTAPQGDSTLDYYDNYLEYLFTHEFTHTLHIDMVGGIAKPVRWVLGRIVTPNGLTPGWVREGIAVQQESLNGKGRINSSFSEMMLRTDILNDQFLAIDQMAGLQYEWPAGNAAYIYGGKFWAFLAEKYGAEKMIEFSHRYSDSMWLFSLNNKARKTYGNKNFLKLKKEWKDFLTEKYTKLAAELKEKGLTSLQPLVNIKQGSLDEPTLSRDRTFIVYNKYDYSNKAEIRKINLDGSGDELVYRGLVGNQYSFSPDDKKIVYSRIGTYKSFYKYYDLHELDLETKKTTQLTKGLRAFHPDYSPDGKKIVFVANKLDSTQLYLWDVEKKEATQLTHEKGPVQFSNPRFSPDGRQIAVSAWRNGNRDLYLYDLQGRIIQQLTDDEAIDLAPSFSPDGQNIYFTSDRSGITNVYRYHLASGTTEQISNVLTGLFQPQWFNGKILVQHYYGRGYDIQAFEEPPLISKKISSTKLKNKKTLHREMNDRDLFINDQTGQLSRLSGKPLEPIQESDHTISPQNQTDESAVQTSKAESVNGFEGMEGFEGPKKYNPFNWKLFVPRYLIPGIYFSDALTVTGTSGSTDPLGRHVWTGTITYRTDAQYVGGLFQYSYNRFRPSFYAGYADYVANYGDIFDIGEPFFEARHRAYVGTGIGNSTHYINGYYFFEHRNEHKGVPPGAFVPPTLGNFSGFGLNYRFQRANHYPASISLEGGPRLNVNFEATDQALGSSPNNEQIIFSGDLREYIPLPLENHVLAFRVAGGIAFGDQLLQGTFRLGSAVGESLLSSPTPRLYPLRGLPQITFAGERALLMSGEYRLPLINPQRGLGTAPIHLQRMYMNFFADYGSVWNGNIDFHNFLLGVGAELRGDFIIGYGLPITGRIGYGIIVYGREFIQGLKDPLIGNEISNGVLILSLGTSF